MMCQRTFYNPQSRTITSIISTQLQDGAPPPPGVEVLPMMRNMPPGAGLQQHQEMMRKAILFPFDNMPSHGIHIADQEQQYDDPPEEEEYYQQHHPPPPRVGTETSSLAALLQATGAHVAPPDATPSNAKVAPPGNDVVEEVAPPPPVGKNNVAQQEVFPAGNEVPDTSKFKLPGRDYSQVNASKVDTSEFRLLGKDYEVNPFDVLCGRGKGTLYNNGNKIFRQVSASFLTQFLACKKRKDKQDIILEIVAVVRNSGGHFLKRDSDTNEWHDIGDSDAAAKVGHSLRDLKAEELRQAGSKDSKEPKTRHTALKEAKLKKEAATKASENHQAVLREDGGDNALRDAILAARSMHLMATVATSAPWCSYY